MLMRAKPLFSQKAELLLYPGCLVNVFKLDTLSYINIMNPWLHFWPSRVHNKNREGECLIANIG